MVFSPFPRVDILGAGVAGLSTGSVLARQGIPVRVFERHSLVGGMAVTLQRDDFRFDLGPHRFYTQDQKVIDLVRELLGNELLVHKRLSCIHLNGQYLEYPPSVANLIRSTQPTKSLSYLWGYLQASWQRRKHTTAVADFEHWVINRFGRPLYELYFEPYTHKVWGRPPAELSAELARRRITVPNLADVLLRLMISNHKNPGPYVTQFWYPEKGIGQIAERLVEDIVAHGGEVYLGHQVETLHLEAGRVAGLTLNNAGRAFYVPSNLVLSTIPLPYLIQAMDPVREDSVQRAKALPYRALIFVLVTLKKPRIGDDHWLYFPEEHFTFNRVSEPRTFSASHAPPGQTSLCAEITCDLEDDVWNMPKERLTEKVVNQLAECGLLDPGEVSGSFTHRLQYGYPIYDVGYEKCLEPLLASVETIENLFTCGRQGAFDYSNMSEAMADGIQHAELISKELIKQNIPLTYVEQTTAVVGSKKPASVAQNAERAAT